VQLLIIRHAIAVPHGTPGVPDEERPLTEEGVSRFRECSRGIAALVERPDALLTSPWRRARQTAEIAASAWGRCQAVDCPALAGGSFEEQATVLDRHSQDATVAVVGHEPYVSALLARLLGCPEAERLAFKKGGAALVDVSDRLADGGTLVFFLPPTALRKIGKGVD
jgi:phosphohistidine phosphatase